MICVVTGTLRDAAEQPLAGVVVRAELIRGTYDAAASYLPAPSPGPVTTAADGTYTLNLHAGATYRVRANGEAWQIVIPVGTTVATMEGLRASTCAGPDAANAVQTAIDAAVGAAMFPWFRLATGEFVQVNFQEEQ